MSTPSQLWEQIVTTALVGTERQALPASAAGGPLADLLARLDAADAEAALLGAAAMVGLYRRSGWLPAADDRPAPEPCPPETLPRCPPRAAQRLAALLAEDRREFLPEWLGTAAATRVRVPEAALPELLDMARARPELWELLAPVAGERGRWLAALNPEWSHLAAADAEDADVWETGSRPERLAWLQRLRASDPDQARERVAATWATDTPEDRGRFLAIFRTGLSIADEPFVEEALDDRRKEVRQMAAELLARLPESRLGGRMRERLLPLLTLRRGPRGAALEVALPEACDKAMVRDGVEPRLRWERIGEKAGWLMQMLAAVPPATWTEQWGKTPAALIDLTRGEWQFALLGGWSRAAEWHGDVAWAEVLLRAWLALGAMHLFYDLWGDLFTVLPVARREALLLELLREQRHQMRPESVAFLRRCRHPWSPELTRAVMTALQRHIASAGGQADYEARELLKEAVHCIPPALGPDVAVWWTAAADGWSDWDEAIAAFLDRLQFRHAMLKEFE
jgi:hypothetical protein